MQETHQLQHQLQYQQQLEETQLVKAVLLISFKMHDAVLCVGLLTLSTGAVVGLVIAQLVVVATVYTCGLLTGLLVRRRKSHTPSASGDLSAPTYEQVLPPAQTSISLKENEAYGHFSS